MTSDIWPDPAGVHHPRTVALLDVTWARWGPSPLEEPENQPWERHRRWLDSLLGDRDSPASLRLAATTDGWVAARGPATTDAISDLAAELARCCRSYENRDTSASEAEAELNRSAHRVHLPLPTLARLLGLADEHTDEHACLDVRWRHHLGVHWLYVTLSLWSSRPATPDLTPSSDGATPSSRLSRERLREVQRRFESVARAVRAHVLDEFAGVASTVLDETRSDSPRSYRPPRFWALFCDDGADSEHTGCAATEHLCRAALGVPSPQVGSLARDTLVVRTALDDFAVPVTVMRAQNPVDDDARPTYLLLPGAAIAGERTRARAERAAREEAVGDLAGHLTDVESAIAARLLDVTTDLDIDHRYGRLHAALADKGARLWDALALDLPIRQGRDLDQLHRLVELVHLTLLQGLADLQRLRASSARTLAALDAEVGRSVSGLEARYVSTARTTPARPVTSALRDEGYVAPTRRWAVGVATGTAEVLDQVTAQLGAITQAFDERRVRDTDKIGRAGLILAVGLGAVGFLTETYGRLLDEWTTATATGLWTLLVAMLAVVIVTALLAHRVWVRRHGHLSVTGRFRRLYPQVRGYAAICRHEKLEEVALRTWSDAGHDAPDLDARRRRYYAAWNRSDDQLAKTFARLVDRVLAAEGRERDGSALRDLRVEVEQWTLFSVLLAERPRALYLYPLPRLTLLYRFCPVLGRGFDLAGADGEQPALVSDADLLLTLRAQCGADLAHVATVTRWGNLQTRRARREGLGAQAFLRLVEDTGIRAGMSRREWGDVHARLAAEVAAAAPTPGSSPFPAA